MPEELQPLAERLSGQSVRAVVPARRGGNNRIFRVDCVDGHRFALKTYPRIPTDPRNRLATEFAALRFLHDSGESCVPRPLAADKARNIALYEWIDGVQPPQADESSLMTVMSFLERLHGYRKDPRAETIDAASEACFSAAEIFRQIHGRRKGLAEAAGRYSALGDYLAESFDPALERVSAWVEKELCTVGIDPETAISRAFRTLSPSDFGFHNMLVTPGGDPYFIDFEYFGWDDPAKLVADFILHPAMTLPPDFATEFRTRSTRLYGRDAVFDTRLAILLPCYNLRWCMILLNEFHTDRLARRRFAGDKRSVETIVDQQLGKAKRMLETLACRTD